MILRNCHRTMDPSATLLLLERVLPDRPEVEAAPGYTRDLTMLVVSPGGRERTQAEFQKLVESAGFEFTGVKRSGGPLDIVEARKS
jgi:hypothetical protein